MISAEDFLARHPASDSGPDEVDDQSVGGGLGHDGDSVADRASDVDAVSEAEGGDLYRSDEENHCQEAALRLLDAAPRSSGALTQRLRDKGYDPDLIDRVVSRLVVSRLIDDEAYAHALVSYCLSRNMGAYGTRQELRKKAVDDRLAAACVSQAEAEGRFDQAAYELARKVARKTKGLDYQVRLRRYWSAGARKGHGPTAIKRYAGLLREEE